MEMEPTGKQEHQVAYPAKTYTPAAVKESQSLFTFHEYLSLWVARKPVDRSHSPPWIAC
jgi:hypothetical protein